MVKKLSDLYLDARRALSQQEDPQAAGTLARHLICHISGRNYEQFLADRDLYASESDCTAVEAAVQRVLLGEPLAYILGQWDFYGMTLEVTPAVLIPRDDTCAVTELAIKMANLLDSSPRILDLCTGTGCIGLAVAHHVKGARVTLGELSPAAMAVAKRNIKGQGLTNCVSCVKVDALQKPPAFLGKFDLIVSNPPYVTKQEMEQLEPSVRDFEPAMALYGGADGLDFYRAISANFLQCLKPGGYLCFEFGMGQGDAVCQILEMNGYTILERTRDFSDIERAVLAQIR